MSIKGSDDLFKKLNKLENLNEVLSKSVRKQSEVVRAAAVRLAPVYNGPWSWVARGELRNSIHTKVEQDESKIVGTVYTNAEYAMYVEFGTGPVGATNHNGVSPEIPVSYRTDGWAWMDPEGNFHYTEGMPAQPFMYPALKSMEKKVTKGIKEDIKAEIESIGG